MRYRKLICLGVAASGIGATGLPAQALAASSIQGAGSTLVAPLMSRWTADYGQRTGSSVVYGAVGSGAGIKAVSANAVDFGASDAPLSPAQAAACSTCVQIPWALSATALGFNIPGVRKLKLTPGVIAAIYLGRIKNWNDGTIARINRGTRLPNLAITPIFRSDGSGDTYAFTDYLSRTSGTWANSVGTGTSVSFPAGNGGKGNSGVTGLVASVQGAIGYISASYLISAGLPAAAIQNRARKYEYPNLKNIENAAQSVHGVPNNDELHIVNPPSSARIAYPISTFTYVIGRRDGAQKSSLKSFIGYVLTTGQEFGPALDFPSLPSVVKAADARALAGL